MNVPQTAEQALIWVVVALIGLFAYIIKTEFTSLRKEVGTLRQAFSSWTYAVNRLVFVMAKANRVDMNEYDFLMNGRPDTVPANGSGAGGAAGE